MSAGNEREFIDFQQGKEKGMAGKLCPLVSRDGGMGYCQEERCAWWHPGKQMCAVWVIVQAIIWSGEAQDNLAREINNAVLRK